MRLIESLLKIKRPTGDSYKKHAHGCRSLQYGGRTSGPNNGGPGKSGRTSGAPTHSNVTIRSLTVGNAIYAKGRPRCRLNFSIN